MTPAQRVKHHADRARKSTELRDAAIRAMRTEGASLRAIAKVAGLSHTAVAKIIANH